MTELKFLRPEEKSQENRAAGYLFSVLKRTENGPERAHLSGPFPGQQESFAYFPSGSGVLPLQESCLFTQPERGPRK